MQREPGKDGMLVDGDSMVRRADLLQWTPNGSSAKLVRMGTLIATPENASLSCL
ncbi:MAG TPA: hypothetical protein VNY78_09545 [Edaphobacter sp.]|nr:hypothetical protein [Edaphobacter sp.]